MRRVVLCAFLLALEVQAPGPLRAARYPHVVMVSVDTLRADRLSSYGYPLPTSPHVDRLLAGGARFTDARTVEPLTNPALASMLTSLPPHHHGATRNGLRLRPGLPSLPKILARHGFATAAFVGNWTLKDELSGLAEHFQRFQEVFTRRRWLVAFEEATAEDLNEAALAWLEEQLKDRPHQPLFLWVHYVEPHAPYRTQRSVLAQLGLDRRGELSPSQRYDSEVAFVDRAIGELLAALHFFLPAADTVVVFVSDHGESLGEHGDWGHGRHLYEPALEIPLGLTWPGRLAPREVAEPALIVDLAPTLLGLLGKTPPEEMVGFDWSGALLRGEAVPRDRVTYYQAHKGAVQRGDRATRPRLRGLLEVGRIAGSDKEILRLPARLRRFDLIADPGELSDVAAPRQHPSAALLEWKAQVEAALAANDLPPAEVDEEDEERLRALGYLD